MTIMGFFSNKTSQPLMVKRLTSVLLAASMVTFFAIAHIPAIMSAAGKTDNTAGSLTIVVKNTSDNQGTIRAALYKTPKEFPMGKAFKIVEGKITDKRAVMTFENLAEGEYAVALLHDRNDNKKMDYNFLGIPSEGYGFSNNVKAVLSPPTFEQAKIPLLPNAHLTITISMQ
jgi:uncharacterized protein (DUF2141 family)